MSNIEEAWKVWKKSGKLVEKALIFWLIGMIMLLFGPLSIPFFTYGLYLWVIAMLGYNSIDKILEKGE
jgi:hypothetical protein